MVLHIQEHSLYCAGVCPCCALMHLFFFTLVFFYLFNDGKAPSEREHSKRAGGCVKAERKDGMGLELLLETCMPMAQHVRFFLCLHSGPDSCLGLLFC